MYMASPTTALNEAFLTLGDEYEALAPGWSDAYLKLFKQIERLLRPGSVLLADNVYTAEDAVRVVQAIPRRRSAVFEYDAGP
jgi:hypothetical protein